MDFSDPKIIALVVVGGLVVLGLMLGVMRDLSRARWIYAGMVFFSALAPQSERTGWYNQVWLKPLQVYRAELYAGASGLLLLSALLHPGRAGLKRIPPTMMVMMLIGILAGVLDLRTDPADGALRVVLTMLSTIGAAMVLPAILRTWEDMAAFMRALGWVGVAWVSGSVIQMLIDPRQMVMGWDDRFVGLLGNPQGTAVYLAPQATILAWLAFNEPRKAVRWIWILALGSILVLLGWTGSRTGALMTLVGMMSVLYAKLGRAILVLPFVFGGLYGLLLLAERLGIKMPFERLVSTLDTRSDAWSLLLEDAFRSPLLGLGQTGNRAVENSFLYGWVVYGPVMAFLIVVLACVTAYLGLKVWQCRSYVSPQARRLIEVICGYFVMYWIGANFEWYIVARIDANIPFMIGFSCLAASIVQLTREARLADEHAEWEPAPAEPEEGASAVA